MEIEPTMTYEEFCVHFPVFQHPEVAPSTNASYHYFTAVMADRGRFPEEHDTQYNLIRATFEYLAGPEGQAVELQEALRFLQQPWRAVLAQLETYPPVVPLLAYTQAIAADDESLFVRGNAGEEAIQKGSYYVHGCIEFLSEQAVQQEREQQREAEALATQQALAWLEKQAKRDRMVSLLMEVLCTVLLLGAGGLGGAYLMYMYLSK